MGAYFGMELNAMAAMLYGQRAEPWHAGADLWGSACQQLLATHGDLGAANAVITTWPLSVGSASQAAFSGQVVGSLASLGEWSAYTGAMSAALRLGGTALNAAQAVMPALQSGYDTAVALSAAPLIGPFAAQVALGLQTAGAGMMEAVGTVMQAPTAVPPPSQGWQGPGGGAPTPASPVPAVPVTDVLDATDKLFSAMDKGVSLVQKITSLAQSGSAQDTLNKLPFKDLPGTVIHPDLPTLAGSATNLPASIGVPTTGPGGLGGGVGVGVGGVGLSGLPAAALTGTLGALTNSLRPSSPTSAQPFGTTSRSAALGARITPGTEPALADATARPTPTKPTPAIAPPTATPSGGGGSTTDPRPRKRPTKPNSQAPLHPALQPTVQASPQTPTPQFTLPPTPRPTPNPPLDTELFTPHP
ncbi:hypothetical protein [Kribbella solani]|uniref:PPE family protein n=1 Tax=Kribbella solani TaxID=236067 RepID=A0A841DTA6_9ACTN|nr:hypothetical protein [Kribbella solani]MBB5981171.1 hypothetical protein [Kribbella solani]